MKQYILPVFLAATLFAAGCKKTDDCGTVTTTAPAAEVSTLSQYITTSGINATSDGRGFYYTINSAGNTTKPTICSNVTVNYVGKLTNGTQFDAANGATFDLSGLIAGWQEGIPLIGQGGSITLYLPPSLAYGSEAQQNIPANSILVFTITLLKIN